MMKKFKYTIVLEGTYNSRHVPYPVTVSVTTCGPSCRAGQVALAAREVMDAILAHKSPRSSEEE